MAAPAAADPAAASSVPNHVLDAAFALLESPHSEEHASFTDLHTHLLGMGHYKFWLYGLMFHVLPRRLANIAEHDFAGIEYFGPTAGATKRTLSTAARAWWRGVFDDKQQHVEVDMAELLDNPLTAQNVHRDAAEHRDQFAQVTFDISSAELQSLELREWMKPFNHHFVLTTERFDRILAAADQTTEYHLPLSPALQEHLLALRQQGVPPTGLRSKLLVTADVVYDVDTLAEALGLSRQLGKDHLIHDIHFRLLVDIAADPKDDPTERRSCQMQSYVFYDARQQHFDYRLGITNTHLTRLMGRHNNDTTRSPDEKVVFAQIANCFSMLQIDGSSTSRHDLVQRYKGHFTPEFYPRRFRLKDSIYSQFLPTLTMLLHHVLHRYQTANVSYVEFSVGESDLLRPWTYRYLIHPIVCAPLPQPATRGPRGGHYDQLIQEQVAREASERDHRAERRRFLVLPPRYTFLLGLNRNDILLPLGGELRKPRLEQEEALHFLLHHTNRAYHHSMNTSAYSTFLVAEKRIRNILKQCHHPVHNTEELSKAEADSNDGIRPFLWHGSVRERVVGLDLFGDELGYPYCPFMLDEFLQLATRFRLSYRVHCGEGVLLEHEDSQIRRAMMAHLHISLMAVRRIVAAHIPCRIGHGVAILSALHDIRTRVRHGDRLLARRPPGSEDSLARILDDGNALAPFDVILADEVLIEINMTSNSYLLQSSGTHRMQRNLQDRQYALCTDDEGVWAASRCQTHHRHASVAAEYCLAIQSGLIQLEPDEQNSTIVHRLSLLRRISMRFAFYPRRPVGLLVAGPSSDSSLSTSPPTIDPSSDRPTSSRRSSLGGPSQSAEVVEDAARYASELYVLPMQYQWYPCFAGPRPYAGILLAFWSCVTAPTASRKLPVNKLSPESLLVLGLPQFLEASGWRLPRDSVRPLQLDVPAGQVLQDSPLSAESVSSSLCCRGPLCPFRLGGEEGGKLLLQPRVLVRCGQSDGRGGTICPSELHASVKLRFCSQHCFLAHHLPSRLCSWFETDLTGRISASTLEKRAVREAPVLRLLREAESTDAEGSSWMTLLRTLHVLVIEPRRSADSTVSDRLLIYLMQLLVPAVGKDSADKEQNTEQAIEDVLDGLLRSLLQSVDELVGKLHSVKDGVEVVAQGSTAPFGSLPYQHSIFQLLDQNRTHPQRFHSSLCTEVEEVVQALLSRLQVWLASLFNLARASYPRSYHLALRRLELLSTEGRSESEYGPEVNAVQLASKASPTSGLSIPFGMTHPTPTQPLVVSKEQLLPGDIEALEVQLGMHLDTSYSRVGFTGQLKSIGKIIDDSRQLRTDSFAGFIKSEPGGNIAAARDAGAHSPLTLRDLHNKLSQLTNSELLVFPHGSFFVLVNLSETPMQQVPQYGVEDDDWAPSSSGSRLWQSTSWPAFNRGDRVPKRWLLAAMAVAECISKLLQRQRLSHVRLLGAGAEGSAVALLAGYLLASVFEKPSFHSGARLPQSRVAVSVACFGGEVFGSEHFVDRVSQQVRRNLELTFWQSQMQPARDYSYGGGAGPISIFSSALCRRHVARHSVSKAARLWPWELWPTRHYFSLLLVQLHAYGIQQVGGADAGQPDDFRLEINLTDGSDSDVIKASLSLYQQERTRPPLIDFRVRSPSSGHGVWRWSPSTRQTWGDLFDTAPAHLTGRYVRDLLLALWQLCERLTKSDANDAAVLFDVQADSTAVFATDVVDEDVLRFGEHFDTSCNEFVLKLREYAAEHTESLQPRPLDVDFMRTAGRRRFRDPYIVLQLHFAEVLLDSDDKSWHRHELTLAQFSSDFRGRLAAACRCKKGTVCHCRNFEGLRMPDTRRPLTVADTARWNLQLLHATFASQSVRNPFLRLIALCIRQDCLSSPRWATSTSGTGLRWLWWQLWEIVTRVTCIQDHASWDTDMPKREYERQLAEASIDALHFARRYQAHGRLLSLPAETEQLVDFARSACLLTDRDPQCHLDIAVTCVVRAWQLNEELRLRAMVDPVHNLLPILSSNGDIQQDRNAQDHALRELEWESRLLHESVQKHLNRVYRSIQVIQAWVTEQRFKPWERLLELLIIQRKMERFKFAEMSFDICRRCQRNMQPDGRGCIGRLRLAGGKETRQYVVEAVEGNSPISDSEWTSLKSELERLGTAQQADLEEDLSLEHRRLLVLRCAYSECCCVQVKLQMDRVGWLELVKDWLLLGGAEAQIDSMVTPSTWQDLARELVSYRLLGDFVWPMSSGSLRLVYAIAFFVRQMLYRMDREAQPSVPLSPTVPATGPSGSVGAVDTSAERKAGEDAPLPSAMPPTDLQSENLRLLRKLCKLGDLILLALQKSPWEKGGKAGSNPAQIYSLMNPNQRLFSPLHKIQRQFARNKDPKEVDDISSSLSHTSSPSPSVMPALSWPTLHVVGAVDWARSQLFYLRGCLSRRLYNRSLALIKQPSCPSPGFGKLLRSALCAFWQAELALSRSEVNTCWGRGRFYLQLALVNVQMGAIVQRGVQRRKHKDQGAASEIVTHVDVARVYWCMSNALYYLNSLRQRLLTDEHSRLLYASVIDSMSHSSEPQSEQTQAIGDHLSPLLRFFLTAQWSTNQQQNSLADGIEDGHLLARTWLRMDIPPPAGDAQATDTASEEDWDSSALGQASFSWQPSSARVDSEDDVDSMPSTRGSSVPPSPVHTNILGILRLPPTSLNLKGLPRQEEE